MTDREEGTGTAVAQRPERREIDQVDTGGSIGVFTSQNNFVAAQRMAQALASSTMVPKEYHGEEKMGNVLVAMELAARTGASVLAVMQSVDVIHGRPAWRASFKIGAVNSSGRFKPLKYRWSGEPGSDEYGCEAYTNAIGDEAELTGPRITIGLAKEEGWYSKAGSKWKTIPQKMLMFRAGSWWVDVYAPEISLGMISQEEAAEATWSVIGESESAASATKDKLDELKERLATPVPEGTEPIDAEAEVEPDPMGLPSDEEVEGDRNPAVDEMKRRYLDRWNAIQAYAADNDIPLPEGARPDWQESVIGKRSFRHWTPEDWEKSLHALEAGDGLPDEVVQAELFGAGTAG